MSKLRCVEPTVGKHAFKETSKKRDFALSSSPTADKDAGRAKQEFATNGQPFELSVMTRREGTFANRKVKRSRETRRRSIVWLQRMVQPNGGRVERADGPSLPQPPYQISTFRRVKTAPGTKFRIKSADSIEDCFADRKRTLHKRAVKRLACDGRRCRGPGKEMRLTFIVDDAAAHKVQGVGADRAEQRFKRATRKACVVVRKHQPGSLCGRGS